MSDEVIGLFQSHKAAEETVEKLKTAGFTNDRISVSDFDGPMKGKQEPEAGQVPTLLTVSASQAKERQHIFGILAQSGAATLDVKQARRHATRASTEAKAH